MSVSENRGISPKSSILIRFSSINHPFWGYHYFWKYRNTYQSSQKLTCSHHIFSLHLDENHSHSKKSSIQQKKGTKKNTCKQTNSGFFRLQTKTPQQKSQELSSCALKQRFQLDVTWATKRQPALLSIESWLVNRDPYFTVYETIPILAG